MKILMIFNKFGCDFEEINLDSQNLFQVDKNKCLLDLGVETDCKIILKTKKEEYVQGLRGGGKKSEEKKCPSCHNLFNYRDVCNHDYCSQCRKKANLDCNCCEHNRTKKCEHGMCYRSCINGKNPRKQCPCSSNQQTRVRDYNTRKKCSERPPENINVEKLHSQPPLNKEYPEIKKYRNYPINDYGNRDVYSHLNEKQWLSYQCLLFFKNCEIQNLPAKVATTWTFFIKRGKLDTKFTKEEVEKVFLLYITNQISIENFRYDSRNLGKKILQNHIISKEKSFQNLVHSLIICFHEFPDLDLVQFFEKINEEINLQNPGLILNSPLSPGMIKCSIGCLISISNYINLLNSEFGSNRSRSNLIHCCAIPLIFNNPYFKKNEDLVKFVNISNYLLDKAKDNIRDYSIGKRKNFERIFKNRETFDLNSDYLARSFWESATIAGDGKRTSTIFSGKRNVTEKIPVRYLPCNLNDFYLQFAQHAEFGQKCKTIKGILRVPSQQWFLKRKPPNVKPMKQFRTGMCPECMEAKEHLKVMKKIFKENCNCKNINCDTFQHQFDCQRLFFDEKNQCQECMECICTTCSNSILIFQYV